MKTNKVSKQSNTRALTLVEVLIVLVVLFILAALLLPSMTPARKPETITCVNNLREIGLGFTIYANDNNDKFPFQISITNGGTMELVSNGHVFPHYQKAAYSFGQTPKILICPFDVTRQAAGNFAALTDSNVSYFLNADATNALSPSILSGDRFLRNNRQPVKSGLFILTSNLNISWTPDIHKGGGNMAWADGSVQQTASQGWRAMIQNQQLATNRLLIP